MLEIFTSVHKQGGPPRISLTAIMRPGKGIALIGVSRGRDGYYIDETQTRRARLVRAHLTPQAFGALRCTAHEDDDHMVRGSPCMNEDHHDRAMRWTVSTAQDWETTTRKCQRCTSYNEQAVTQEGQGYGTS